MIADMTDDRPPLTPRSWLSYLGRKGGSKGTPAQVEARLKNLALGRQARIDKLTRNKKFNPKNP
jgi:hypothetical protein